MSASRTDTASITGAAAAAGHAPALRVAIISALCGAVEWLFVLVVAILPIDAYILVPGKQSGIFLSEALTAQAFVLFGLGYLLALAWRIPFPLRFPLRWLAPLGALLGASLISLIFAHARGVGLRECAQYAFFLVLFLLAVAVAGHRGIRNRVFWAILTGYYIVIILGLIGTLTNLPDIAQIVLGIQRNTATLPGTLTPRAESTFRFPDELNAYLLLVLPFLFACLLSVRSRVERVIYGVYVALGLWLLILTYARSALIIIVVITPLLLYLLRGARVSLIGVVVVALGLGAALARDPALLARGVSLLDPGNSGYAYRLATWKWALSAFVHHPLFGVGPRNLQFWPGAPWADAFRSRLEDNGESSYINTLADLGMLGFAALVFCIVAGIRRLRSGLADHTTWLARSWHIGFLVGFCALLLDSLVHPTITSTQVTALLCAFVGLAGRYPHAAETEPDEFDLAVAKMAAWKSLDLAAPGAVLNSRVVFLVNSPGYGGAESHSVNLARELHRQGVRVLVVCPPGSPLPTILQAEGIAYRVMALGMPLGRIKGVLGTLNYFNPFSRWTFQSSILALAAEERSMFVCPFPREQLLATPLCQRLHIPVLWVIHAPMAYLPHRYLLRSLWHLHAQEATAVLTVSEAFTWRLTEDGFPAQRLLVLRNAIPERAILSQSESSVAPGRLVVVSRLNRPKGVQYAIRALPRVLDQHPEAHLVVVGAGPYERSLRRLAHRLGIQERVRFLGYQANPAAILSTASVALCPSVDGREVLPTAILEAFGVAAPVVASNVGSVREVVRDGVTGLMVAPGDVDALAHAINSLLDDPERARTLGAQGQDLVRKHYNFAQVGTRFLRMLEQVERGEPLTPPLSDAASVSGEMRAIHRPRLLGNVGLFTIAKALAAFGTALWTVLAARALTPGSYGDLMLAVSLVELAAIITDAGVTTAATQALAAARDAREARQWTIALIYLKLALGLAAMVVTIIMGVALPFSLEARLLMIVLSPGLIFVALNSLTLVFRARMRLPIVVRISSGVAIINIIAALVAYALAPSAFFFALADLLATVVGGTLTIALVYRETLRGRWATARSRLGAHLALARGLLLSSLVLGLSMALNIFYVRIDVPLLALMTNSAQVAIYTSAYRVIDVVSLLPVAAAGIALPLLVSLGQRGREHLVAFAQQYLDIAVVCGLFIAFVLTLVGHEVITLLYGSRYAASAPVLLVLSWAGAAMFVTNVFSPLVVALDKRRTLLLSAVIGLTANIGLNLLLIPRLGPVGCAWATLCTELVVTAPLAVVSVRTLRWRLDPYTLLAAIEATGAAVVCAIVSRALPGWESDALAILAWLIVFTMLAPMWSISLVRSLAARLSGARAPQTLEG